MSFKLKLITALASAVAVGSFAIATSAQETPQPSKDATEKGERHDRKGFGRRGPGKMGPGRGFPGMRGFFGIELTEAQKTQIKQIHEANKPDGAVFEEMKAIGEARRNGTLTEDQKARAKVLREQARTKGESVHQQILAVLTPEQRRQIETRKAEMKKRMEERRQQRREPLPQMQTQKTTTDKPTDN